MGSDAASVCRMASVRPNLPPLSSGPLRRHYLRQAPGAVAPHAGICAEAAGKPAFLPRPLFSIAGQTPACNAERPRRQIRVRVADACCHGCGETHIPAATFIFYCRSNTRVQRGKTAATDSCPGRRRMLPSPGGAIARRPGIRVNVVEPASANHGCMAQSGAQLAVDARRPNPL